MYISDMFSDVQKVAMLSEQSATPVLFLWRGAKSCPAGNHLLYNMNEKVPAEACRFLDQGGEYNFDNCKVLAYRLQGVDDKQLRQVCEAATDSYAREILKWPNGRLAKPEIFKVDGQAACKDISDCVQRFLDCLQTLLKSQPPRMLPIYYKAFIAASKDDPPGRTTLVLFHKPQGEEWRADYVGCPVRAELGLTVTSLTMGDEAVEDVLERLGN
jgi:hypothetical protein